MMPPYARRGANLQESKASTLDPRRVRSGARLVKVLDRGFPIPSNTRVRLTAGVTDMRHGFNTLAAQVQALLAEDPYSGQMIVFRGRRGDLLKIIWCDGQGACLFSKRLERGAVLSGRR